MTVTAKENFTKLIEVNKQYLTSKIKININKI